MSSATPNSGEERFPRPIHGPNRFFALSVWLKRAVVLVGLLAVVTLLLPPPAAEKLGLILVVLLIAIPLGRVIWFVQRWTRRGDLRFAAVGIAVLVVVGVGALLA
ncbi:unannotated protein [freshwater metagenome]|uniref:Unannotated protein n=1 Tax=freshwater metagenome TaxID=449393 RepID=A0A6J7F2G9_9ZZZZ|nr:hypothetical protein [Actinomycetota bacterium]MSY79073.1 hypothetical protein [Actinomycetota bacterium]